MSWNFQSEAYGKLQHFVQHSLQTRALQLITPEDTQQRTQLNKLLARYRDPERNTVNTSS